MNHGGTCIFQLCTLSTAFKLKIVIISMRIGALSIHCVGVQAFKHSELKIKECLNDEIAHSCIPKFLSSRIFHMPWSRIFHAPNLSFHLAM